MHFFFTKICRTTDEYVLHELKSVSTEAVVYYILYTVEPHYKEVRYNKTLLIYNKVNLLVPALYISLVFLP